MSAAQSSTPSFSSIEIETPVCPSSVSIVVTSRRCGTFSTCSGSGVSSAAHSIGSAAFFAPEIATSPSSATPPSIRSLSTLAAGARPLFGRQRLHRERVDLLAHALAERAVHELMLPHARQSTEARAHDDRLEMMSVAGDFDVVALEALLDASANGFWIHARG